MIFCIDIGNSNIKYAIFDGKELKATFRVTSQRNSTSDEYGVIVRDLLKSAGIEKEDINGVVMSSVIPSLNYTMEHIIVDSVSAISRYGLGSPIVCIDFGTATTFDIISHKGELIGVVIAPGIKGSLDSLVSGTANLPTIELEKPPSVIAKNTINCMQAGIFYGFSGLVGNIVNKIKTELGRDDVKVIATGGLGKFIYDETDCIDVFDATLTLNGLRIIYEMNIGSKK